MCPLNSNFGWCTVEKKVNAHCDAIPEGVDGAQHEGRVLVLGVVVEVGDAEHVVAAVAHAGQHDAEEDEEEARPVHAPTPVVAAGAVQRAGVVGAVAEARSRHEILQASA